LNFHLTITLFAGDVMGTILPICLAWLYFPSAILLGALHGLEPGHSKTMMGIHGWMGLTA
jgi:ABC-type nickel/cobalt efflux system permease component RcnA